MKRTAEPWSIERGNSVESDTSVSHLKLRVESLEAMCTRYREDNALLLQEVKRLKNAQPSSAGVVVDSSLSGKSGEMEEEEFISAIVSESVKMMQALDLVGVTAESVPHTHAKWDTCRSLLSKKRRDSDIRRLVLDALLAEKVTMTEIISTLAREKQSLVLQVAESRRSIERSEEVVNSRLSELTSQYEAEIDSLLSTIDDLKGKLSGYQTSPFHLRPPTMVAVASEGVLDEPHHSGDGLAKNEPSNGSLQFHEVETQTDVSLEFVEACRENISNDGVRTSRREKENDLLELLVREIQVLRENALRTSSSLQLLSEQRLRFLRSVNNFSTFTERSSMFKSLGENAVDFSF